MVKWKIWVCNKCWEETLLWFLIINKGTCNKCKDIIVEEIKEEVKVVEKEVQETSWTYNWLPIYSANYLNKKLHKDYNSIKSEKICVAVPWWYILHEDIIKQFILSLNN